MEGSNNISRSTFLTILSQVPSHLFGILAGVFITRILGVEGKGVYTLFYTNVSLLTTVFGLSVSNSIVFFTANKKINKAVLSAIILVILLFTLVASTLFTLGWINSNYVDLFLSEYKISLSVIALFISTILISQVNLVFTSYFQGKRNFKIANRVLILNSVYSFLGFGIAYMLKELQFIQIDFIDVVLIYLLILLINTFHWWFYYRKSNHFSFDFRHKWKENFKLFINFTGLNHFSNIILFVNSKLAIWIIAYYLDEKKLGIYSLAIGLGQLVFYLSEPLKLVLESFLNDHKRQDADRIKLFARFSRIQFSVIIVICILGLLLAPYLIPLVYGIEFTPSISIFNIFIVSVLFSCQAGLVNSFFISNNMVKYNLIASIIGLIINVIATPLLIQWDGISGAAHAQNITYAIVYLILLLFLNYRTQKFDWNIFLITKTDVQFIWNQLIVRKGRD